MLSGVEPLDEPARARVADLRPALRSPRRRAALPSGLKAIELAALPPRNAVSVRPRTSHTRSGPPFRSGPRTSSAAASSVPSGEKASAWESSRHLSSPAGASVCAFHSVSRPPSPVTASSRPSGLNATAAATRVEARSVCRAAAACGVDQVDRPVAVGERERAAVGADRDASRRDSTVEAPADGEAPVEPLVAGEVPEDRARVERGGEHRPPVRGEVEAPDLAAVPGEALRDRPALDVPDDHLAIVPRGHERPPVGREAHPGDRAACVPCSAGSSGARSSSRTRPSLRAEREGPPVGADRPGRRRPARCA